MVNLHCWRNNIFFSPKSERNQAGTELKFCFLLASFHGARRCCADRRWRSYLWYYPALNPGYCSSGSPSKWGYQWHACGLKHNHSFSGETWGIPLHRGWRYHKPGWNPWAFNFRVPGPQGEPKVCVLLNGLLNLLNLEVLLSWLPNIYVYTYRSLLSLGQKSLFAVGTQNYPVLGVRDSECWVLCHTDAPSITRLREHLGGWGGKGKRVWGRLLQRAVLWAPCGHYTHELSPTVVSCTGWSQHTQLAGCSNGTQRDLRQQNQDLMDRDALWEV